MTRNKNYINISTFASDFAGYSQNLIKDSASDFVSLKNGHLSIPEPPFIKPHISITSFSSNNILLITKLLKSKNDLSDYFGLDFAILPRAIICISSLITYLGIKRDENIAIYKTFDNQFISRCVTDTISNFCNWTRSINTKTKAVMVIHEFGFPYKDTAKLKKKCDDKGIPLIENCAWGFGSLIDNQTPMGSVGNYAIYSLPKIIPVQYGGVITGVQQNPFFDTLVSKEKRNIILNSLNLYMPKIHQFNKRRVQNWLYLEKSFGVTGLKPLVKLNKNTSPGVFILKTNHYQKLHNLLTTFGIESGRYYHEKSLYIPVHQNLNRKILDYIIAIINGSL